MVKVVNTRLTIRKINKVNIESVVGIFFGLPRADNQQLITDLEVTLKNDDKIEDGDIFRIDNLYNKTIYVKVEKDIIEIGTALKLRNSIMISDDII